MHNIQTESKAQRESKARSLISAKMSQIQTITNGDKSKASAFASAIVNMVNDGNLSNCSTESIVNTAMQIVQIGLNPNKLFGQAYVVPYNKEAQLQIGYKGLIALGYRNGWKFRAICVYKCDEFDMKFAGIKDDISFVPNYDERDETNPAWVFENLKGVLVFVADKNGSEFSEFVPFKKLEQLRTTSPNQNAKGLSNIWAKWAEEMYKAKAIKHVASRLPINDSIAEAFMAEDEPFRKSAEQKEQSSKGSKAINLNELITQNEKEQLSEIVIEPEPIMPGEELEIELKRRGLNEEEAERIINRFNNEQIMNILADPNSIDALLDEIKGV
ncbi:recombinase RecT [Campylobacter sp. faydin G-24]|uniref:Recombinase RecT n=1 Tax=Campylobacter anatolicus TaxID=2829105 RepID=A0ABS5HJX2_9BACT|nr:RecT family recombinase [Campylobacter anatolicus]MBR8461515.1 recombinase RecT [Campylobacter anatolicus]MBR8464432.1 recombinase RecT [Campylobacter anatolicus]MBR8466219.1 recombinase RecT [Campylobacter anatolicus]